MDIPGAKEGYFDGSRDSLKVLADASLAVPAHLAHELAGDRVASGQGRRL